LAVFGAVGAVTWRLGPGLPVQWFATFGLTPGSLRWHTPFTYWLLHEHLLHVSANMLFLFVFGGAIESALGRRNFVVLFVAAAAATGLVEAGVAQLGADPESRTMVIGASGPIAFVLGMFAARYHRARIRLTGSRLSVPAVPVIVGMALGEMVSIAFGTPGHAGPTPAHWAHVSGFLLGIGWAHMSGLVRAGRREYRVRDADRAEEEGSRLAAPERWEAVLSDHPGDREATLRLIAALTSTGDRDRARDLAARALADDLAAHRHSDAAALYGEVRDLDVASDMPVERLIALGDALAQHSEAGAALAVFDGAATRAQDPALRRTARMRAATCALRRSGDARDAARRLEAIIEAEADSEWRAYAEKLLREATSASD
jgi:membrane associated rhomboid family serine protease